MDIFQHKDMPFFDAMCKIEFLNHILIGLLYTKFNINGYYKQRYYEIWLILDNFLKVKLFPIGNFNNIYALC